MGIGFFGCSGKKKCPDTTPGFCFYTITKEKDGKTVGTVIKLQQGGRKWQANFRGKEVGRFRTLYEATEALCYLHSFPGLTGTL